MATEIVTITGVETKSGVNANTGKSWQLWKVRLEDGRTLSTFSATPGNAAMSAIGGQREVDISVKSRDGYPDDLVLDAVRPVPEGATAKKPSGGTTEVLAAHGHVPPEVWEAKDRRMARMSAIKAACELWKNRDAGVPPPEKILEYVDVFEARIYRDMTPEQLSEMVAADEPDEFEDVPF